MAWRRLFTADLGSLSHSPTWMLIVGTVVFWLELFVFRLEGGHTTWLAWGVWLALAGYIFFRNRSWTLRKLSAFDYAFVGLALVYLSIAFYAALFPPHLVQEFDVINYHIMVPRQHLIRHDFAHISWSVADLFLMPLNYALSPFWLATSLPNKFPQFIVLLATLFLVYQIVHRLSSRDHLKAVVATAAVMGLHMVAIQAGTAMMDMVMLYCVVACVDSLINKRYILAGVEGAFFFWSKSFIPPMMIIILISLIGLMLLAKWLKFRLDEVYVQVIEHWRVLTLVFILASAVIVFPSLIKAMYYAGSPIYGVKITSPLAKVSSEQVFWLNQRIDDHMAIIDGYGHGRSFISFLKHFWLIAVPERGVNNAFDYPVGLMYLLVLGPFLLSIIDAFRQRKVPVLSLFIILWWGVWWMGSQQTRFLLIPMCLMILVAVLYQKKLSRLFIALVMATMMLEIFSLVNAHRVDWGKSALSVLRERDRDLVRMGQSKTSGTKTVLDYPDVAFASFAVTVRNNNESIFVFPQSSEEVSPNLFD